MVCDMENIAARKIVNDSGFPVCGEIQQGDADITDVEVDYVAEHQDLDQRSGKEKYTIALVAKS